MTFNANPRDVASLFAEFGVRMGGIAFDLFVVFFLTTALMQHVLTAVGIPDRYYVPVALTFVFLYFTVSWASPMRATPVQFLFGMRVVDEAGERLGWARASLRSVVLLALVVAALALYKFPSNSVLVLLGLISHLLLLLAAVMPNRQAAHDLLARSLVVNRTALKSAERHGRLCEHVADKDPHTRRQRRPSIVSIVANVIVLGIPMILLSIGTQVANDKNMRSRVAYAYAETRGLRTEIELRHIENDEYPGQHEELGVSRSGRYPDGGYYELENDGVIRIRFEVRPELRNGSIILTPVPSDDRTNWRCHVEGDIEPRYLPALCRG
jgi:uncharacterized RDD family membrane protein YckC